MPTQAREVIIEEMESYVKASLTKDVSFTVASPNAATDSRFPILHVHTYWPSLASKIQWITWACTFRFVSIQSPKSLPKDMPDFTAGNRIGGNRKFFTHFHYWGAFAISGQGRRFTLYTIYTWGEIYIYRNTYRCFESSVFFLSLTSPACFRFQVAVSITLT